ncbi:MAG: hypothetical protein ACRDZ9_06650, partial [Acidimicrobiales bacterium]
DREPGRGQGRGQDGRPDPGRDGQDGEGQGQGPQQDRGQGGGEGPDQGPGQGRGRDGNQGRGQGGGGASGRVGGTNTRTGTGQGGPGTPGGTGRNPSGGIQVGGDATIYDPEAGDQLIVGGRPNAGGRSETVGRGDGPTRAGATRVPLADALPRYDAEATRALDRLAISPSLRALVRLYFDSLAQGW